MRSNCFLKGVFVILLLIISDNIMSIKFETDRIKKTFNLLPNNLKSKIDSINTSTNFPLNDSTNLIIIVLINSQNQISHIGIDLKNKKSIDNKFIDAYNFIEYSLLNLVLLVDEKEKTEFIKKMELKFLLNNKPTLNIKNIERFLENLLSLEFSLDYNDYFFQVNWNETINKQFSIQFPTLLYLLKGMDKVELEQSFFSNLSNSENTSITNEFSSNSMFRINKYLYFKEGERFETDNFRSDIFLEKSRNTNSSFKPFFSDLYPIESFSNLFICNLDNTFQADVNFRFYKNARSEKIPLTKLQAALSKNKEIYFGVYSITAVSMKATIIYYDPILKYIHMMIVEADSELIFRDKNSELKVILYLYIPREEIDKDKLKETRSF